MFMKQKEVAILYIALGRYICFWPDFYNSCEERLKNCKKHYFIWTDNTEFYGSDNENVTVIPAKKQGWPYDSLLRFEMFLEKKNELLKYDYVYFFNANMKFINDVDLSEIAPHPWHTSGLVAGLHPSRYGDSLLGKVNSYPYERRPESTAYIPYGQGKFYVCGAFNGGTSSAFMEMCDVLAKNVRTDMANNINAAVDDESHLNAYLYDKDFLLCGRPYLFNEHHLKYLRKESRVMVKIISQHKDHPKWGGKKYLRGESDKKMPDTWFIHFMIGFCRFISVFIPDRMLRQKVRTYFGTL